MKFTGQCIVAATAQGTPQGKFRVTKPPTNSAIPDHGCLRIIKGDYVSVYIPPATPTVPSPPPSTNNNDPIINTVTVSRVDTDVNEDFFIVSVAVTNNDSKPNTFYAYVSTTQTDLTGPPTVSPQNIKAIDVSNSSSTTTIVYTFYKDETGQDVVIPVPTDTTYYVYVYVIDSDGDFIVHREPILSKS
jgi:hypothetical protein